MAEEEKKDEQTLMSAVTKLLNGDSGQKFLMGLVLLGGGSNLWNTSNSNRLGQEEIQRSLTEIHQLHDVLEPMLNRQKQMAEGIEDIKQALKK